LLFVGVEFGTPRQLIEMIKVLDKIKIESKGNERTNWEFRSWLKFNAPDNIDKIVSQLSQEYSAQIAGNALTVAVPFK